MNLFDEFTDRSELLRAIESEIIEAPNADGVTAYRLPLYVDQVVGFTGSDTAVVVSQQRVYLIKLP